VAKLTQLMRQQLTSNEVQEIERATDGLDTKREVAARLRRSTRTVDDWMRKGKLPYLKIGKTVLFRWQDVLEKLNSFRVN